MRIRDYDRLMDGGMTSMEVGPYISDDAVEQFVLVRNRPVVCLGTFEPMESWICLEECLKNFTCSFLRIPA